MPFRRRRQSRQRDESASTPSAPTTPRPAAQWDVPDTARWPSFPPPGYLCQLDDDFQAAMAAEREHVRREDCDWYHTVVLKSGEVVPGAWDLRGGEADYLGHVKVKGQRVLELGPASGYLTFHMEQQGAEVVAFEAGFDVSIDIIPRPGRDLRAEQMHAMRNAVAPVHNSWWYLRRDLGASAKVVYADIYDMPGDLGTFDTTVVGSILLHLRRPFDALEQAARRTTGRVVVTDVIHDESVDPESDLVHFAPLPEQYLTSWWQLYPGSVKNWLRRLGFPHATTTYHTQKHHRGHDLSQPADTMNMWTVVADRG